MTFAENGAFRFRPWTQSIWRTASATSSGCGISQLSFTGKIPFCQSWARAFPRVLPATDDNGEGVFRFCALPAAALPPIAGGAKSFSRFRIPVDFPCRLPIKFAVNDERDGAGVRTVVAAPYHGVGLFGLLPGPSRLIPRAPGAAPVFSFPVPGRSPRSGCPWCLRRPCRRGRRPWPPCTGPRGAGP